MQSQLRWADHVKHMINERITKIPTPSQVHESSRMLGGNPLLSYTHKHKHNLNSISVPLSSFEEIMYYCVKCKIMCMKA